MPSLKDFIEAMAASWPVALAAFIGSIAILIGQAIGVPYLLTLPGWILGAAFIVASFAGAILVVTLLRSIIAALTASAKAARARADQAAKYARDYEQIQAEGVHNLEVLDEGEQQTLKWLLQQNSRRFSGDIGYTSGGTLYNKRIIHNDPNTSADNVYMVTEAVWAKKDELLRRYSRVWDLDRAPWDRRI